MRFSGLLALLQRKGGESPSRHVSSRGGAMSQRRGCLAATESVLLGANWIQSATSANITMVFNAAVTMKL